MFPTSYLRFVERNIAVTGEKHYVRILQQWWSNTSMTNTFTDPINGDGEWRDVPMEKE